MSRLRVPALAAALAATLLGGCPERVTWEAKPLDPRFTANAPGSGHQEVKHGDGSAKSDGGGPEHQDVEHNPNAQPPGPFEGVEGPTVKVSGVITAPGDDPIDIDLRAPDPDAPGGNRHLGMILPRWRFPPTPTRPAETATWARSCSPRRGPLSSSRLQASAP